MTEQPKIAVAGHLVADEIIFPDRPKITAPGGISYNLAALVSVMRSGLIIPVCEIGADYEETFNSYFGNRNIVDSSAIRRTSLPQVVNRLVYSTDGSREERNSRIPDQLSLSSIKNDEDAVLINFISGEDLNPVELQEFRGRFDGVIFCDFHSLALGRDESGKRYYRRHPEYEKYLSPAKIAQMNIAELATISGVEQLSFGNIIAVCSLIHGLGPEICIITLGGNGAVLSVDRGKSAYHLPPVSVSSRIDPTGCGDTFASVFLFNYLTSGNPLKSALIANRYAAAKVTFAGIEGFERIEPILRDLGPDIEPVKIK